MNLLNKELLGIAILIAVLYGIQQWVRVSKPKKEGFMDSSQTGIVIGVVLLFLVVTFGIGYTSYKIPY